jgi:hypothetical protein
MLCTPANSPFYHQNGLLINNRIISLPTMTFPLLYIIILMAALLVLPLLMLFTLLPLISLSLEVSHVSPLVLKPRLLLFIRHFDIINTITPLCLFLPPSIPCSLLSTLGSCSLWYSWQWTHWFPCQSCQRYFAHLSLTYY